MISLIFPPILLHNFNDRHIKFFFVISIWLSPYRTISFLKVSHGSDSSLHFSIMTIVADSTNSHDSFPLPCTHTLYFVTLHFSPVTSRVTSSTTRDVLWPTGYYQMWYKPKLKTNLHTGVAFFCISTTDSKTWLVFLTGGKEACGAKLGHLNHQGQPS